MENKRVVITGMGCITPIGNNVTEFWNSLMEGKSGAATITKFDTEKQKTKFACEVKNFIPEEFIDKKELKKMDISSVYAMVAADEAVKNAGLDFDQVNPERCGVIFASGIGGIHTLEEQLEEFYSNGKTPRFSPFYIIKMILNMSSGLIAIKYNLQGISFAPVSACASSNHAMISAWNFIRTNQADLIICGGTEASITPSSIGGFNTMKALSTNNEDPKIASRPYDTKRDGFVIGEGAGALILEEYEHAVKRGATIYAEVMGGGMSSDAYHISSPHPEGRGAALCMRNALHDAQLSASDISYINTHGTSTPVGDIPELLAVSNVFGNMEKKPYVSSTKSMTGHLLGAAGAIEAIISIQAIRHNVIPPTINITELDPDVPQDIDLVINKSVETEVNYVLSNGFGFGGHNASVIFGRYTK